MGVVGVVASGKGSAALSPHGQRHHTRLPIQAFTEGSEGSDARRASLCQSTKPTPPEIPSLGGPHLHPHPQAWQPTCFMNIWMRHFLKLRTSVHTARQGVVCGEGVQVRVGRWQRGGCHESLSVRAQACPLPPSSAEWAASLASQPASQLASREARPPAFRLLGLTRLVGLARGGQVVGGDDEAVARDQAAAGGDGQIGGGADGDGQLARPVGCRGGGGKGGMRRRVVGGQRVPAAGLGPAGLLHMLHQC